MYFLSLYKRYGVNVDGVGHMLLIETLKIISKIYLRVDGGRMTIGGPIKATVFVMYIGQLQASYTLYVYLFKKSARLVRKLSFSCETLNQE